MATPSPVFYQAATMVIDKLGARRTSVGINLLIAWMIEEDGVRSTMSCHNPMNTTLREPGSYSINSVGVQCFRDWTTGIQATVATLTQGRPSYGVLVQGIKTGDSGLFFGPSGRGELLTWVGQGDPGYPDQILSIYRGLPSVPSQYLNSSTPSGNPVSYTTSQTFTWGVVAVASFAAIGYAAFKLGYVEEMKHRWKLNRFKL